MARDPAVTMSIRLRSIARVTTEQRLDTSSAKPRPRNGESTQRAEGANGM
jgi:hypothetical protein